MKTRFADKAVGFGAFLFTGSFGFFATSMAGAFQASGSTVATLGLVSAAVAIGSGVGVAQVSARLRSAISDTVKSVAKDLNLDPDITDAVLSGPRGLIKYGLQNEVKYKTPQTVPVALGPSVNIKSVVRDAVVQAQPAETPAPETPSSARSIYERSPFV